MVTSIQVKPSHPQPLAPGGGATTPAVVPQGGTSGADSRPAASVVLAAFVGVAAAAFLALRATNHFPYSATPVAPAAGLTIFAVFFVAAQGLERLLEPLASLLKADTREALNAAKADAQAQVDSAQAAAGNGGADPAFVAAAAAAQTALDAAATAKAKHQSSQANRTVAFWAIASAGGIVSAAILKLYLLTVVGVASPGRVMDVIATGLIIGGGTKPLHDLASLITAQKESSASAG